MALLYGYMEKALLPREQQKTQEIQTEKSWTALLENILSPTNVIMSLLAPELQIFCHFAALKIIPFISVNNASKDHVFINVLNFIFF